MSNFLTGLAQLNPQVKRHNGGTTTLTLDQNGTTNATMLYVNGVAQTPGIDFNVSGATLTTTSTLPSGTNICTTIQYFSTGIVNTVADNAIGLGQMASGVDGNVISYDASGNPVAVATGSDGQVLTSTGAGSPPAFETLSGGTALQRVKVFSSAAVTLSGNIPMDTSIPQITEGTELYTLVITPKSTDSVLYFRGLLHATPDSGSVDCIACMFVDTTANALFTSYRHMGAVNNRFQTTIYGTVANSSTSEATYRLRVGAASSTDLEINQVNGAGGYFGGTWGSGFDITEVAN